MLRHWYCVVFKSLEYPYPHDICDIQIQVPALINVIKESGLILATCGPENEEPNNVKKQETYGVDAIIQRRVLRYNTA